LPPETLPGLKISQKCAGPHHRPPSWIRVGEGRERRGKGRRGGKERKGEEGGEERKESSSAG